MIEKSPAHPLARDARLAIEEALLGLADVASAFDREGVRDRLLGAVEHAYVVADSGPLARAHLDALAEGEARVREVIAMLREARVEAGSIERALAIAAAALREGHEAVLAVQLARRDELYGRDPLAAPAPRPFRAGDGAPVLHAFARRSLVASVDVGEDPAPPIADDAPRARRPATFAELAELARRAADGAFAPAPDEPPPAPPPGELPLPYEPACSEVEVVRRLARSLLEDVAGARGLRVPSPIEAWDDVARNEQRLVASLDALASLGPSALPVVSIYHAEARAPDPGRAFAAALALGCVEGHDTVGAALMMLRQSAPEEHAGWLDGLSLAPSPAIDGALADLARGPRLAWITLALDALAARGRVPDDVVRRLAWREEPAIAVRVARALATSLDAAEACARLEAIADATGDDDVRLAAIEALAVRGHGGGLARLRAWIDAGGAPTAAAALVALAGAAADLDRLLAALARDPSAALVRAVGRFGHPRSLDALVALTAHADAPVALAAAEALARVTGAGPREVALEPWTIDLAFEPEVVAGMTRPVRRVERAAPDTAAWREVARRLAPRLDPAMKIRDGRPFAPIGIVDELASPSTPPDARDEARRELALQTGVATALWTRDWVARQRRELAAVRALVARAPWPPGAYGADVRRAAPAAPRPDVIALATEEVSVAREAGALPFRDAPAAPPPPEPPRVAEQTAEVATAPGGPALPFAPAPSTPAPPPRPRAPTKAPADVAAFLDRALAPPPAARADAAETEEIDPARRRRLVRFDPTTGEPLAEPYWQDLDE